MAKDIIRSIDLRVLKSRLDPSNKFHQQSLGEIQNVIKENIKKRLAASPAHTNSVGGALRKAFLEKSIRT